MGLSGIRNTIVCYVGHVGPRRLNCNFVLLQVDNNYLDGQAWPPARGGLLRRQQHYHLGDSRSVAGSTGDNPNYCCCCCWLLPAPRTLPELDWRRKLPEEGWRGSGGVPAAAAGDAARNLLLPAACCKLAVNPPTPAAGGGLLDRLLLPPPAAPSKPRNTITPLPLPLPSAYAASAPPLLPEPAPLSEPDRPPPAPPSMLRPKLEPPRKLLE